uniref:Uncharacterized protein n=1 Tax=Arundo donax TaxID=35708 RepID=A0A0A8YFA5_ARUDO
MLQLFFIIYLQMLSALPVDTFFFLSGS